MKVVDYGLIGDTQTIALVRRNGSIHGLFGPHFCIVCASVSWLAGCAGEQSALDPAGRDAERIAGLFGGWPEELCLFGLP